MIDNFSILLTHALMGLALWRLLPRADLDPGAGRKSKRAAALRGDDPLA